MNNIKRRGKRTYPCIPNPSSTCGQVFTPIKCSAGLRLEDFPALTRMICAKEIALKLPYSLYYVSFSCLNRTTTIATLISITHKARSLQSTHHINTLKTLHQTEPATISSQIPQSTYHKANHMIKSPNHHDQNNQIQQTQLQLELTMTRIRIHDTKTTPMKGKSPPSLHKRRG